MNLEHRKEIKFLIPFENLETQAKYADLSCVENVKDLKFLEEQFGNYDDLATLGNDFFEKWNTTSVGNIAYVILNCGYPNIVARCRFLLDTYKNYIFFEGLQPAGKVSLYYIMNKNAGYLGNSPMWWGLNHNGYVANLDTAGKYSFEEAEIICRGNPEKNKAFEVDYIDNCKGIQRIVDSQYIDSGKMVVFE